MVLEMTRVETSGGELLKSTWRNASANEAAVEHYIEHGEVPVVVRADDVDAGLSSVYPGEEHPIYHHGAHAVDTGKIDRDRGRGFEVALVDLENGEELVPPTARRQHPQDESWHTAEELRERFGGGR